MRVLLRGDIVVLIFAGILFASAAAPFLGISIKLPSAYPTRVRDLRIQFSKGQVFDVALEERPWPNNKGVDWVLRPSKTNERDAKLLEYALGTTQLQLRDVTREWPWWFPGTTLLAYASGDFGQNLGHHRAKLFGVDWNDYTEGTWLGIWGPEQLQ